MFKSIIVFKVIYLFAFFIVFLFVKCYLNAFRYCILGIIYAFIFRYVCKAPDRALYKYSSIIITISIGTYKSSHK